jgi:succinate dehydrogenase hydrophobic membrane anchor protein
LHRWVFGGFFLDRYGMSGDMRISYVTFHWLAKRISGVLLLPCSLWFCFRALPTLIESRGDLAFLLASPWGATWVTIWTVLMLYHGLLGMHDIIEDYVRLHPKCWIWGMNVLTFFLGFGTCLRILTWAWSCK